VGQADRLFRLSLREHLRGHAARKPVGIAGRDVVLVELLGRLPEVGQRVGGSPREPPGPLRDSGGPSGPSRRPAGTRSTPGRGSPPGARARRRPGRSAPGPASVPQVQSRPHPVETREVLEALEERTSGVRHDDEIEVAPGVRLAPRHRAEGDHLPGAPDVGRDPSPKLAQIAHHRALHGAPSLGRCRITTSRRGVHRARRRVSDGRHPRAPSASPAAARSSSSVGSWP
jgi:hypothetical protein